MNIVEILVTAKNLTGPAFTEAKAGATAMESSMAKLNKTANLAALGMAAFLGESIAMASKFDSEMTLLVSQAGVAEGELAGLKKGVLDIAAKVGSDPDSLAEALYHVESNFESMGITSQQALKLTETAAKGAAIGHADLVDVTNALTAAVAAQIPGVEDLDQAMGVLNATVGVGDMKMQDLAMAFSSGMVATVKGFGLSIKDVGAALAVFGDNNIRGSLAGNQLRMSVMALGKPISTSEAALKTLGLTQTTLANDMQRGGLKLALEDLVGRMNAAGISAEKQGQIITDAFGRKAGSGLNILVGQLDRFEGKFEALEKGADNFGEAWERTQQTFAQQTKQLNGSLQALMITLGEKLIPPLQKVVTYVLNNRDAMLNLAEGVGVVVASLAGFAVVSKIVNAIDSVRESVVAANAAMLAYRTRVIEMQAASLAAGAPVNALTGAFSALSTKAKIAVTAGALGLLVTAVVALASISEKAPPDIDKMTTALTKFGHSGEVSGELAKTLGNDLQKLGHAVEEVSRKRSGMDSFFEGFYRVMTLNNLADKSHLTKAKEQIDAVDQALAGLVQQGHADLAAAALKRFQDALLKQDGNPEELTGKLNKYHDALSVVSLQEDLTADSMGDLGRQAMDTSKKLDEQAMTAKGLHDAIVSLNDINRSAIDAMSGFEASLDAAGKAAIEGKGALHEHDGELDLTTEAARTAMSALNDFAAKTDAAGEAALAAGESQAYVNGIYNMGREKLTKFAQQMGLTRDEARALTDTILATPDKTAYLRGDIEDLTSKIATAELELRTATGEKRIRLKAEIQQAMDDIRYAQNEIDQMHGRTLPIIVSVQRGQARLNGGDAHGGIIGGAATGGIRNNLTWVGENGPELVRLPPGAFVHSNPDSQRMAAGIGGGGPLQLHLTIDTAGRPIEEPLLELIRNSIRVKGGNVQTVLGQN